MTSSFFCFLPSKHQFDIPEEEVEWVGLSLVEAVEKQRQLEHKVRPQTQLHETHSALFKDATEMHKKVQ